MTDCTLESSVVDWVIEHPAAMKLFEELGIDCSCAGKSLEYACGQAGLKPEEMLARLRQIVDADGTSPVM